MGSNSAAPICWGYGFWECYLCSSSINQWLTAFGGEAPLQRLTLIGTGAWIILLTALAQIISVTRQTSLTARFQSWYRAQQEKRKSFDYTPGFLDSALQRVPLLSPDVRAMVLKDIRIFWRDTAQWGQSIILFSILAFTF